MILCCCNIGVAANVALAIIALFTLCWQLYSFKKQKFENHFFELLRIHKQNVEEMKMGSLEKREIFKGLYYEFCTCMEILNNHFSVSRNYTIDKKNRMNLAYKIFFYGNEFNNTWDELKKLISDYKDVIEIQDVITDKLKEYREKSEQNNFAEKTIANTYFVKFVPYLGHSQQLGHYFRHLWQIVNFVDKQCFCTKRKYKYIKIIRAQLSDYEQLMFYYNAFSDLGKSWFEGGKNSLIVRYKLIKNIPLPIAFGYSPLQKFFEIGITDGEMKNYFEWYERGKQ